MEDKLLADIQEIQKNIEKEKDNRLILVWLCQKIDLECQILHSGGIDIEDSLRADIDNVFICVQKYKHKGTLSENDIMDVIDLLVSINMIGENELQRYSSRYVAPSMRAKNDISRDMYGLFVFVARQLLSMGKTEIANQLIEHLCMLSRTRNHRERHKQLVVRAMNVIFEKSPSTICAIASIDEKCYEKDITIYAGDFYWMYACSLLKDEKADAAKKYFEKCYGVRRIIYGDRHWLTALAKRNKAAIVYTDHKDEKSRNVLMRFVRYIERNKYMDMNLYEAVEAETVLSLLQGEFNDVSALPEYEKLIDIYDRFCDENSEIENVIVSKRMAWNFRGNYYMQKGDCVLAKNAFENALKETGDSTVNSMLSDDYINTKLMAVEKMEQDAEASSALPEDSYGYRLDTLDDHLCFLTLLMMSGIMPDADEDKNIDSIQADKDFVKSYCESIIEHQQYLETIGESVAMYVYAVVTYCLQRHLADENEQRLYLEALNCIYTDVLTYKLSKTQCQMVLQTATGYAWSLRELQTKLLINKLLRGASEAGIPLLLKAEANLTAAAYYGKKGKDRMALDYVEIARSYLAEIWHSHAKYANDIGLSRVQRSLQVRFNDCYAIVRHCADIESTYEHVLQCKALTSLIDRERNRILHTFPMDSKLIQEIQELQIEIISLEESEILSSKQHKRESLENQLRELEHIYDEKCLANIKFKEITWPLVREALPDHCAVLEYQSVMDDFNLTPFKPHVDKELEVLELFFVKKQNGKTDLKRFTIRNLNEIRKKAEQFIRIYQEKSSNVGASDREDDQKVIRHDLYEALIKPVIDDLDDIETIYFAPDSSLKNLPFELLYEDEMLEEHHQIIKIECARDFLFTSSDEEAEKTGLVIGSPAFYVKEIDEEINEKRYRKRNYKGPVQRPSEKLSAIGTFIEEITSPRFSEIEAHRVADYLSVFPRTGKTAMKKTMQKANLYQNIHISTSGFFESNKEYYEIYSSCLMLAAVKNERKNSANYRKFGNGIITANEISRMDLKKTKLVVLSSALKSREELLISKGFQEMVSALASAGVKYVIAHLWNAPETIGTVILMDAFYQYYIKEKMNPPLALTKAKKYLRTLTVDEMRKQGWFDMVRNSSLDTDLKQNLEELEKSDGRIRPYQDEIFWGGISCYRCN